MTTEQAQKYPTWVHAFFGDIIDTLSAVDKYEYPHVPYVLEFFKRIVPVGNVGLYQDSDLRIIVITPMESSIQLKIVKGDVRIIFGFDYEQYIAPYILAACTEEPSPYLAPNIKAEMTPEPAKCDVRWRFYTESGWVVRPVSEYPGIVNGWINLLFDIYRAYINIR